MVEQYMGCCRGVRASLSIHCGVNAAVPEYALGKDVSSSDVRILMLGAKINVP